MILRPRRLPPVAIAERAARPERVARAANVGAEGPPGAALEPAATRCGRPMAHIVHQAGKSCRCSWPTRLCCCGAGRRVQYSSRHGCVLTQSPPAAQPRCSGSGRCGGTWSAHGGAPLWTVSGQRVSRGFVKSTGHVDAVRAILLSTVAGTLCQTAMPPAADGGTGVLIAGEGGGVGRPWLQLWTSDQQCSSAPPPAGAARGPKAAPARRSTDRASPLQSGSWTRLDGWPVASGGCALDDVAAGAQPGSGARAGVGQAPSVVDGMFARSAERGPWWAFAAAAHGSDGSIILSSAQLPPPALAPPASAAAAAASGAPPWRSLALQAVPADAAGGGPWGSALSVAGSFRADAAATTGQPPGLQHAAGSAATGGGPAEGCHPQQRLLLVLPAEARPAAAAAAGAQGLAVGATLVSWRPDGGALAVAVGAARGDACWLLLLLPDLGLLHVCAWHGAVGWPLKGAWRGGCLGCLRWVIAFCTPHVLEAPGSAAAGLLGLCMSLAAATRAARSTQPHHRRRRPGPLHPERLAISSLAWLEVGAAGMLAAVDTFGQVAVMKCDGKGVPAGGGMAAPMDDVVLERLQLIDTVRGRCLVLHQCSRASSAGEAQLHCLGVCCWQTSCALSGWTFLSPASHAARRLGSPLP